MPGATRLSSAEHGHRDRSVYGPQMVEIVQRPQDQRQESSCHRSSDQECGGGPSISGMLDERDHRGGASIASRVGEASPGPRLSLSSGSFFAE